jgi:hypothetical protein
MVVQHETFFAPTEVILRLSERTLAMNVNIGAKPVRAQSFILKLAVGVFLGITIGLNFKVHVCQHFALLATSFLQGRLDFIGPALNNLSDMTPHKGRYYWPLGPLPAVVLMPFELSAAAVGVFFYQG